MIVTTAITDVTPTMMPTSVSAVRSLFCRRLPTATKNASQIAATRTMRNERKRDTGLAVWPGAKPGEVSAGDMVLADIAASLLDLLVFFDQSVANGNHAMRASSNVVFVRNQNDGVAFFVELLEEVHDFVTGGCIERARWLVSQ